MTNRKRIILEAAARLFSEKGFSAAHTSEIARRAGVAEGTIFHHFKTKEALLLSVFKDIIAAYTKGMEKASNTPGTGLETIERLIRFHFHFTAERSDVIRVLFRDLPFQYQPADSRSPLFRAGTDAARHSVQVFALCLERGRQDGSIVPVPVWETAHILRSLLYGLTRNRLLGPLEVPDLTEETIRFCRRALACSQERREE